MLQALRLRRGSRRSRIARRVTEISEEIRILGVGLGKQPVALGIAGAAGLLRRRVGFGHDHGGFAIGVSAELLGLLRALSAELGGLALTLGLHALVDRLAVLLRQVGAADPHVDHLDAVGVGLGVELAAN